MPGPTVKEILLRWGIDNTNWKKAISELSVLLEKSNRDAARAQEQATKRLEAQKAKLKEIIADRKSETAELEKQIDKLRVKAAASAVAKADSQARLASEKVATVEAGKQAALQKSLQQIQKTLQQEVYTKLMNEKLVTAEINRQNAALRLQQAQQRAARVGGGGPGGRGGHGGGGGFFGGLFGGLTSGFGGTLTSAVAMGELAAHSIENLLEKVKEFVKESGPLEQVREQFEKLASLKGVDSVKFLEDLKKSTHGLVDDLELYRTANKFMQSGIQTTEEDLNGLIKATVGLARSQGRDATQAVQALNMAMSTGRFQRLAYITGLTREEMAVRGLTATMSSHQRVQLEYENALRKITQRYKEFGEPSLTFTDRLQQASVVVHNLFEALARGIVQSQGMQSVFKLVSDILGKMGGSEGAVEKFGRALSQAFAPAVEGAKLLWTVLKAVFGLFSSLYQGIVKASGGMLTFSNLMQSLSLYIASIRMAIERTVLVVERLAGMASFGKIGLSKDEFKKRASELDKRQTEEWKKLVSPEETTPRLGSLAGSGKSDEEERNIALERQLSQLRLKQKQLDAQIELSIEKGKLEQLKQANEEAYNAGLEDLDAYVARKKSYRQTELDATIKEINAEKQARLKELKEKAATEFMDPKSQALERENIIKESTQKEIEARNAAQRELDALDMQAFNDKVAARKRLTDVLNELEKASIEKERQNVEYSFQQGEIGAQEYLEKRIQFIEQDYQATKAAEEKKLSKNKNSQVAQAAFAAKMAKAAEDREKALTKLTLDEVDIRTRAVEASYDRAQRLIDAQIKFQQATTATDYFGGRGAEQNLIEAQISLLKSRLEEEVKSLELTEKGSAAWFQQYEKIQQTKEALLHYNEELIKSKDIATGIAGAVRGIAEAAGRFPKGGRVSAGLGEFASILESNEQFRQRREQRAAAAKARAMGAPVTPEEIFRSLQKVSQEAGQDISRHLKAASDSVEQWRQKLVTSGDLLDDSIKKTTDALLTKLIPAIEKAAGTSEEGGLPLGGPSGAPTASSPLGTTTASDMMSLLPAALTGGQSEVGPASQQAATGLSAVAQQSKSASDGFRNLITTSLGEDGLIGYFKNLGKNTQAAADDLSNFADSVSQIAGNIGGMVSAGKGEGGPFQAGLRGMASGGSLGGQIGSMFGPMGGLIGQGIGMGVGMVVGVFAGKARKEAEKIAKTITAQFNAVLVGVQNGTVGLGKAVESEIQIIQQAVAQLSHKKGGRDELKQILPQMEQQLAQLQAQQQSILKNFDKQLEIASAPESAQELVQPIQQIIDTYQQYILAGGNVELANKYLQYSFRSLVTQGLDKLNQAEQDAVNNALNYNDLLLQRQELIQNTNQQIQEIMSQGVAVRQMPEGVTKARQIQQLMLEASNQQARLDEEIAVSKHKLDNESKIFNLATTRVGLETQLIALQNAQIDKQDASVASLLQEVMAFSGATPTNLPTALQMIGLGGSYINPSMEPGLRPQPPVRTGIYEVDLQNQLQYQQALAYYNQQTGLSSTATLPALGLGDVPGGTMGVTTSQLRASLEQNINDMSAERVSSETQLVNLKMKEISMDMQRIAAWKDLITYHIGIGVTPTLEDLLQNVYQTRARQGYGGFNGEIASPV